MEISLKNSRNRAMAAFVALCLAGGAMVGPQPARGATADIVVGPAGCGEAPYITDGVADDVQIENAISNAVDGDVIELCEARYEYANDVEVNLSSVDITIRGVGDNTILDGNDSWNILAVYASDLKLTLQNLTLTDGFGGWGSAVLFFDNGLPSHLTIEDSGIVNNSNPVSVGAVALEDGDVTVRSSIFGGNRADGGPGGAIYTFGGNIVVEASTFVDNYSVDNGGAIYSDEGSVRIVSSEFFGNYSEDDGGAISAGGFVQVVGSNFEGNDAGDDGGAVWANGEIMVRGSTFVDNDAAEEGGAINTDACFGSVTITANSFSESDTGSSGGAVNVDDDCEDEYPNPQITFTRNRFFDNSAFGAGGAVDIDPNEATDVLFRANRFVGNSAMFEGGAIWVSYAKLLGNTFSRNSAQCGGAVFVEYSLFGTAKFNGFRGNATTGPARGRNISNTCDVAP